MKISLKYFNYITTLVINLLPVNKDFLLLTVISYLLKTYHNNLYQLKQLKERDELIIFVPCKKLVYSE